MDKLANNSNDKLYGGFFLSDNPNVEKRMLGSAKKGDFEVVKFMIDNKIVNNLSCVDDTGDSLLHILVKNNKKSPTARYLIDQLLNKDTRKGFLNIKNRDGNTPLHIAVSMGDMQLAERFIEVGANKSIKNNLGKFIETAGSDDFDTIINLDESRNKNMRQILTLDDSPMSTLSDNFNLFKKSVPNSFTEMPIELDVPMEMELSTSEEFIRELEKQLTRQIGGGNKKIVRAGSRKLNTERTNNLSRLIVKQSTEIHKRVVKKVMELLKLNEEESRPYKAYLYNKVKKDKPELNNLDRSIEMEKLATEDFLKSIKKSDLKKIKEAIAQKQLTTTSKTSSDSMSNTSKTGSDNSKTRSDTSKIDSETSKTGSATSKTESGFGINSETSLDDDFINTSEF